MPETDIGQADYSDLSNQMVNYSVGHEQTEAAGESKETGYLNSDWPKFLGYYKSVPELQTAIDAKANWTLGAGFSADEPTIMLLGNIKGNGKDSFNEILMNMIRTYTIGGDSFAEIIRDKDGILVNLKPLDPGSIRIVQSQKGRIKRYEQVNKTKKPQKKFNPDSIFHLSRKRLADEMHGISVIPAVEWIILARNEAMSDWKRVLHRNVDPLWIMHLDTDDTTEISNYKTKYDAARRKGEIMYVPKGVVVPELVSTAQNASLNPLTWINQLNDYFFQAVNVPQIIVGNAKEFTDASAKIVYLSYEQAVKGDQLYIEEQVLGQLNLAIQLTFPATLQNELISDQAKASSMTAAQPNDTQINIEGRT